jgi:hypothetical protein
MMEDTTVENPLDKGCDDVRALVMTALIAARALRVNAQEEEPLEPQAGMTADEAQSEQVSNVEIAVASLETAAMRLNVAKHVYLGDSTLFAAPEAAAPADTTADTSEEEGSDEDASKESGEEEKAD